MKSKLFWLLIGLILLGCAQSNIRKTFTSNDMIGSWVLVSDTDVLIYNFNNSNNNISTTLGTENGPLTGPIWKWKINQNNDLEIDTGDGEPIIYQKIMSSGDRITVKDAAGNELTFKRNQPNKAL